MKIYGIHAVRELILRRPDTIKALVMVKNASSRLQELLSIAKDQGVCHRLVNDKSFNAQIDEQVVHQGVYAEVVPQKSDIPLFELVNEATHPLLLVVLDGVQDPQNLGACMRTCCAMGVDAMIIPKNKAVSVNDTALKVACGAGAWLPVYEVTNLSATLKKLKQEGLWCLGTSEHAPQVIGEVDTTGRSMVVIVGSEGKGMRRLTTEHCDFLVRLPTRGPLQSLNVSVALGMTLYEVCRLSDQD